MTGRNALHYVLHISNVVGGVRGVGARLSELGIGRKRHGEALGVHHVPVKSIELAIDEKEKYCSLCLVIGHGIEGAVDGGGREVVARGVNHEAAACRD